MKKILSNTFSSMRYRNFRLFIFGQFISLVGNWMQVIALSWVAYELTQSATSLGVIAFLSYAPLLIFGIFGGLFVDRHSKYRILFLSQAIYSIAPLIVSYYFFIGEMNIYILYFCALSSGILRIIDNPVRQTFRFTLIPVEETKNAVSLFSASNNFAKIIGPLIAGFLLATFGAGWCFLLNGLSFWFVLVTLAFMRKGEFLQRVKKESDTNMTLFDSLSYVWKSKLMRNTLILSALFGALLLNMQVMLPIFIKQVLNGDVLLFAFMMSVFSFGAVLGGIYSASNKDSGKDKIVTLATILSLLYLPFIFVNSEFIFAVNIFFIGIFTSLLTTTMNSYIILKSDDRYLGMVSSLWTMSMVGTSAIGGVLLAWASENFGIQIFISVASAFLLFVVLFLYRRKS